MAHRIIHLLEIILDHMNDDLQFEDFFTKYKKEILEIDHMFTNESFDDEIFNAYDDWGFQDV